MTQQLETAERQYPLVLTLPSATITSLEQTAEEFHFDTIQESLLYFLRLGTHAGVIVHEAPILPDVSSNTRKATLQIGLMFIRDIPVDIPSSDMRDIQELNTYVFHKPNVDAAVRACLKQGLFVQEHILNSHLNSKTFREFRVDDIGKVTFTPHGK